MRIMRRKLRVKRYRIGDQKAHCSQIGHICVELARENRIIRKSALLGPFDFAVPISAFHEAYWNAFARLFGEPAHPAQQGNRALTVGLHRKTEPMPAIECGVEQRFAKQLRRQIETVLFLGIDGEAKTFVARGPRERQQPGREFRRQPFFLAGLKARMEC